MNFTVLHVRKTPPSISVHFVIRVGWSDSNSGVIHKSLWDFWPQRYSSRDLHAEGEHVNRGGETPSVCRTVRLLHSSFLLCLSWLLLSRVRKFPKDLWITLYLQPSVSWQPFDIGHMLIWTFFLSQWPSKILVIPFESTCIRTRGEPYKIRAKFCISYPITL
jgi:hypothetical protein